ncbi:hypothetical protein HanPI659440_Chr15g0597941 [Helianthus annuus]|nr:hypothetical protein HanPI659440_Chr15g0597941 [Helianthus annuus]
MLRVAARLSRRALSSVRSHSGTYQATFPIKQSLFTSSVQRAPRVGHCVSGDILKLVSHGSHTFSSFASGFSPLKHKPLESLIDIERAKHQTPEDLAQIWDDVSSCYRLLILFRLIRCITKVFAMWVTLVFLEDIYRKLTVQLY